MAGCFKRRGVGEDALQEYDKVRVEATAKVVLMNRANPPDTVLRVVYERTGGKRFDKIEVLGEPEYIPSSFVKCYSKMMVKVTPKA